MELVSNGKRYLACKIYNEEKIFALVRKIFPPYEKIFLTSDKNFSLL